MPALGRLSRESHGLAPSAAKPLSRDEGFMSITELETLMLTILERELGAPIGVEANLFECGVESLALLAMIDDFEEACGFRIDILMALEQGTVRNIVRSLE